ncbi:MAG: hypothetical protein ACYC5J_20260 [Chloroflexota bacterium]
MSGEEIAKGLLYVEMDCPAQMEEEFHSWYNTEHVPERAAIPGFTRSRRYAALEGAPRWLASYELDSTSVLESPEYLGCSGANQSPWTARITSLVSVYRGVYDHAWGKLATVGSQVDRDARGLLAIRYHGAQEEVDRINSWHDAECAPQLLRLPGVLTARRYGCVAPQAEQLVLYELSSPWIVQSPEFSKLWTEGWETVRRDLPAFRRTLYIRILPAE